MSADTKLGRIPTLATAAVVGISGIGDPGVMASSEDQFQAIVQPGTMLSISSPLVFDPITQAPSPRIEQPQGENLTVIEELNQGDVEFINSLARFILSPTPEATLMQERLAKSPKEFFNAIQMPNARVFRYYPEGRQNTEGEFHSELDIIISEDETTNKFALSIQLEPSGTFGQNTLNTGFPKPDQYSGKQLALLMEYTFLMPKDLKALPWNSISSDPKDPLIEYSSGLIFKQSKVGRVQFLVEAYTNGLLYFSVTIAKEQKTDPIPSQAPGSVWPDGSRAV